MSSLEVPYRGPEEIIDSEELHKTFQERFPYAEYSTKAVDLARTMIGIASLVEKLKAIGRIPQGEDGRRENLAEHSYMVALATMEAARILELKVDTSKILKYSLIHDLLELITGDTNTFAQTDEQRAEKEQREKVAKDLIREELPPEISSCIDPYEEQEDFESRFVRAVDKLAPQAVNYVGHMRVLAEDLGLHDYDPDRLASFHDTRNEDYHNRFGEFPEVVAAHGLESIVLERKVRRDREALRSTESERAPTETERKFLIDIDILSDEVDLTSPEVRSLLTKQFYVEPKKGESESRVRSINDEIFQQTVKSSGTIQRTEVTTELDHMDQEVFDLSFKKKGMGNIITKTRYIIPLENGLIAELDIYDGCLKGLATVEVEFKGRDALMKAEVWHPPYWFGKEVTEDSRFKNKNLALIDSVSSLLTEAT